LPGSNFIPLHTISNLGIIIIGVYIALKCPHGIEGYCGVCENDLAINSIIECIHPKWIEVANDGSLNGVACDFGIPKHEFTAADQVVHTCESCHAVACGNCKNG